MIARHVLLRKDDGSACRTIWVWDDGDDELHIVFDGDGADNTVIWQVPLSTLIDGVCGSDSAGGLTITADGDGVKVVLDGVSNDGQDEGQDVISEFTGPIAPLRRMAADIEAKRSPFSDEAIAEQLRKWGARP